MKREFINPKIKLTLFSTEDIVTASPAAPQSDGAQLAADALTEMGAENVQKVDIKLSF